MNTVIVIDKNSGEIIEEKDIPEGGIYKSKILTSEQQTYIANHIMKFNDGVRFGKLYVEMMPYIKKELSGAEWMFFCQLMNYIDFEECALYIDGDRRKKQLCTVNDIADYLGQSYAVCYKHIKSLIKKEMIYVLYTGDGENKTSTFFCTPYIFFRGKNLEKTAWKAFKNTRWARYNEEICRKKGDNLPDLLNMSFNTNQL